MATESVQSAPGPVTRPFDVDAIDDAAERVSEASAILEMAWRISHDNQEDFKMLQRACYATMRILDDAAEAIRKSRG